MAYYHTKIRRAHFLDELRGFVVLLMIIFHGAYDLVYLFGVRFELFFSPLFQNYLQPFIACNFILIAGIVSRYSRNNIKRGALVFGCGMLMTIGTYIFMPALIIRFGVLHLLGACMMLYGIITHLKHGRPDKLSVFAGVLIFGALFIMLRGVPSGYLGLIGTAFVVRLPHFLYQPWLAPFGFPNIGFNSSDYFPLIPWFMLFSVGNFLGVLFHQNAMPEFFYRHHVRFLGKIGQHSLLIYLLHQPLLYGLLFVVFKLMSVLNAN